MALTYISIRSRWIDLRGISRGEQPFVRFLYRNVGSEMLRIFFGKSLAHSKASFLRARSLPVESLAAFFADIAER